MADILTDDDFNPECVNEARHRNPVAKKDRKNAVYFILRDTKGRDNAKHAKQIIEEIQEKYNIKVTPSDITEAYNQLVEMNYLPDLVSERNKGYYRAVNQDEYKIGLYERAHIIAGHYNSWDNLIDNYRKKYPFDIDIPTDPIEYKALYMSEIKDPQTA